MPPFWGWADLPWEIVCRIGDILDLQCYASARGTCTDWRCALAPPSPSLLLVQRSYLPSADSLPARRSFQLKAISWGRRCVGCSNGWLALSIDFQPGRFILFHPVTAAKIDLPPLTSGSAWVSKIVFAPNPATDDFSAATICGSNRLAYVTAGARTWAVHDSIPLATGDQLTDVLYHEKGTVYCLTSGGDVHLLRLPERCRREPAQEGDMLLEPYLNAPFDPATRFAPPYNKVCRITSAKNLVFCQGNLYQVWRNASCDVTPVLGHRVAKNEVFVLRYYPLRQPPCWDVVTDLGGYSVFIGRNNAVSMSAQGVPGLMGNCVYWIGDQGMVFDMANGTTHCLPAAVGKTTICWYFLSDMINNE